MKTFSVGWILETLATQEGLNVQTEGIDDVCFGMTISSDKTFGQVAKENSALYNYQIVDGDPIRLVRRAVNDDLVIDYPDINETDCIRRGTAPAVSFSRVDPATLPRQVEVQHIDPARDYAVSTQTARHTAAPTTNTQISVSTDFIISAQQGRDLAFDLLYRIWAQQLAISFEHPDLTIEPSDTFRLTAARGVFVCLVARDTLNFPARTNTISATILLTSKGVTVTAPEADPFYIFPPAFTMAGLGSAVFVGSFGNAFTMTGQGNAAFVGSVITPFTMAGVGSAAFVGSVLTPFAMSGVATAAFVGSAGGVFTMSGTGSASFTSESGDDGFLLLLL